MWRAAGLVLAAAVAAGAQAPRLARLDGSGWVQPGRLQGRPAVLLFWDADCGPCLAELARLAALKQAFPGAMFVTVSLSPRDAARRTLARYAPNAGAIDAVAPKSPAGLLAGLGDPKGVLPFHAAFRADGRLCGAGAGGVDAATAARLARACTEETQP